LLRKAQNPDGGWAFYPGKASWLEPTVYAALALHGQLEAARAWELIRGWQLASGGWRPSAEVPGANWTTALAVLLGVQQGGQRGPVANGLAVAKGLEWLRNNAKDGAWSWRRSNAGSAEPTALAIVALRSAGADLAELAQSSEKFLLADTLTPETCGPALVGLQGTSQAQGLAPLAARWVAESGSPLTRAWIRIGLRVNNIEVADPVGASMPRNLAIVALEALAAHEGNHRLLRAQAVPEKAQIQEEVTA
jgi:hypothetical protein